MAKEVFGEDLSLGPSLSVSYAGYSKPGIGSNFKSKTNQDHIQVVVSASKTGPSRAPPPQTPVLISLLSLPGLIPDLCTKSSSIQNQDIIICNLMVGRDLKPSARSIGRVRRGTLDAT
jgi:hypothetical protein